jgi:hypothetical protein
MNDFNPDEYIIPFFLREDEIRQRCEHSGFELSDKDLRQVMSDVQETGIEIAINGQKIIDAIKRLKGV